MTKKTTRKPLRLKTYDYSKEGSYFITICIQNRENRLGNITNQTMYLNPAGVMIEKWLNHLNQRFENCYISHYIIMPNHIHFVLTIETSSQNSTTISTIIQWFKTMTTNEYIRGVKKELFPPFTKRIWQRNYYEHIIRNQVSYEQIVQYIENNPISWENDALYQG